MIRKVLALVSVGVRKAISMSIRSSVAVILLTLFPCLAHGQTTIEYYHLDALGTVRAITNQNGILLERHDYLPFGEEWNAPPQVNPRKITGKERDPETGYDYFGARYLSAKTARFTTTDPAMTLDENLADPQRWNRYTYVRNNPLRHVDPDGRDWLYRAAIGTFMGSAYARQHDKSSASVIFSGSFAEVPRAFSTFLEVTRNQAATAAVIAGFMPGVPKGVSNPIPSRLSRVIPNGINARTLGRPGEPDVFVTAAEDIAGMTSAQISRRLGIPSSPTGFRTIEFPSSTQRLASPVFRANPDFSGGGRTIGGAREFVIPNQTIPPGSTSRIVE
jgi:RHS repeat-associated protein